MKPIKINNKWYIEIHTKEFGDIIHLDDSGELIPLSFRTEEEALNYIKNNYK